MLELSLLLDLDPRLLLLQRAARAPGLDRLLPLPLLALPIEGHVAREAADSTDHGLTPAEPVPPPFSHPPRAKPASAIAMRLVIGTA